MSSAPGPAEIAADASWLAQAFDPAAGLVRLVRMTPETYRAAAFLDDRMLDPGTEAHVRPWDEIAQAAGDRSDARWIFHIGHVGSTLVARMLGELAGVLSVREPRLLRDLMAVDPGGRRRMAEVATRLYSRTFAADQVALVKTTSFVSEMAPELVTPSGRALFMYASPRAYIEGILAGENSVKELRLLAPARRQRMAGRAPPFATGGDADLAAEAWACEMTSLERASEVIGENRILWADFDRMLADLAPTLERAAEFLKLPASPERMRAIAGGPLIGRYSKAAEYDYSPALRHELLAEARHIHGRAITHALGLLETAARASPMLKRALARTEA
jgi:hypothetical protein